jgi:hypothetical protein
MAFLGNSISQKMHEKYNNGIKNNVEKLRGLLAMLYINIISLNLRNLLPYIPS